MKPMSKPGRYVPLPASHPLVGKECLICEHPMRAGEAPSLVEKEDGNHDGLTRECVAVHERCLYGVLPR